MMKDIEIKISRETRMVDLSKTTIGNDGENLQGNLVFSFTDDFVKGQGRLEYVVNGESKYAFLLSGDDNYYIPIKSVMTKEGQIDMQLVITEGTDENEIPIFKSNVFYVSCKKSINAEVEEEEEYYSWIEIANTKLNEIDELVEDVETKLANGEFDGKDGVDGKDGKDFTYEDFTEEQLENLRGPQGIPGEPGEDGKDYVLTEADKEEIANNINEENETYLDTITPKSTSKGELVHVTDALNLPTFENKIDGNVKQETTKGNQLLNPVGTNFELSGLTFTNNENGSFTIKGTSTSARSFNLTDLIKYPINLKKGEYYTQSLTILSGTMAGSVVIAVKNANEDITYNYLTCSGTNLKQTKQVEDDCSIYSYTWYVASGMTVDVTFKVQLEQGSTATEWEEYSGGQASPNSEYPQEIEVLEGYNLFNGWEIGKGVNTTTGEVFVSTNVATSDYIKVDFEKNTNYYLSGLTLELRFFVSAYDKDFNYLGRTGANSVSSFLLTKNSFTANHTEGVISYLLVSTYEHSDTTGTIDMVNDLKTTLNVGSTQKPYIPYGCVGIKVNRKNLFDKDNANILKGYFGETDTTISSYSNRTTYLKVKPNRTYTVTKLESTRSFIGTSETQPTVGTIITKNINFGKNYTYDGTTKVSGTITTGQNDNYIVINYSNINTDTITNAEKILDSIQVELGTVATDYEPYQEQIVPLDLKGNFVGKVSDTIKDYLVTDKKKYWLVKNVGKVVLDGSEKYADVSIRTNTIRVAIALQGVSYSAITSHLIMKYHIYNSDIEGQLLENNYLVLSLPISVVGNTLNSLKTWLSNNNIEVYYQLAKPQIIELGELPEPIKTFEGVNNIQLLANLDTEIEVTYGLDVKKYFENKLASIQEQIL